jgi:glucose-1-phosphate adenylyltransferase
MGNYVFSCETLYDALLTDARNEDSKHDMGGDIIPMLVGRNEAQVYDFRDNTVPARPSGTSATGATSARSTRSTTRTRS